MSHQSLTLYLMPGSVSGASDTVFAFKQLTLVGDKDVKQIITQINHSHS